MDNTGNNLQLSNLVNSQSPDAVMDEVKKLLLETLPGMDLKPFDRILKDTLRLFEGRYPGYHSCNTDYHNLGHTLDNVLALSRLIHGGSIAGQRFKENTLRLGLLSSFLHDTGYIQTTEDNSGTGAKYTLTHVERSIAFARTYMAKKGYSAQDTLDVSHMILATDIKITDIPFSSVETKAVGLMVGTADLLGQMADRTYLEKLLLLYLEFKEGDIPGYEAERDMLVKTTQFYALVKKRLDKDLGGVYRFMLPHFHQRWGIQSDLYSVTIDRNINYLKEIMTKENYRNYLRRGNIVDIIKEKEKRQD